MVLTWDDPGDDSIDGYVILRRNRDTDAEGQFTELAPDTGTADTTYTDGSVAAETPYTYRIKAINEHGVSARSRWFHIDTLAAPTPEQGAEPPAKPTGLSATASHDQVILTWDDPGDDSIDGYVILRRNRDTDAEGEFTNLVTDTGTADTTYTDGSVAAETPYTYRIKAINGHGVSERSRWFHIDTLAAPQETVVEGDDQDEQGGDDDAGGAPGHATPGGAGARANVSEGSTDLPNDNSTTGEVDVGGSVMGNIDRGGDGDWFGMELEAGKRYQIDLEGMSTGRGTLVDPVIFFLYDADGNMISGTLANNGGVGKNDRLIYTPTADGTYFVSATSNAVTTGTYTLSVIVLGANGASEADTDFPGDHTTTGRVEVGASATGNIGSNGDTDWFAVDLEAGKTYQIDMEGSHNNRGSLLDPLLSLFAPNFAALGSNDDIDISTDNLNSRLTFTATTTGTYFLHASEAVDGNPGTYTLSVREVTPPPSGFVEGDTDLPDDTTTPGRVVVNGFWARGTISEPVGTEVPIPGQGDRLQINYTFDSDWFAVELDAGRTYRIDLRGGILISDDGTFYDPGLTLQLPEIIAIFDSGGSFLSNTSDREGSGPGRAARVEFTPNADGTYYISASGVSHSAGGYELTGTDITDDPDEHTTDRGTTGTVAVGGSATGKIDFEQDVDWFKVTLTVGTEYRIDLEGLATGRGSLYDPWLRGIFDADGNEILGYWDDDGGEGHNSRLLFTPDATGTYHVAAGGLGYHEGTYTLSVSDAN